MLNLSLLANKWIIAAVLVIGAILYHDKTLHTEYKKGKTEVTAQWNKDIEIREAVLKAVKDQREKERLQEEQRYKDAGTNYDFRIKEIEAKYFASSVSNKRLRDQLATASTAGLGLPGTTETQCVPYVRRIEEVSGLLAESTELLGEGRRYNEELAAKVEALQRSR